MTRTEGGALIVGDARVGGNLIGRDQFVSTINVQISCQENYLAQIWDQLDADLQDALTIAFNLVKRQGGNTITVESLLAALLRLCDGDTVKIARITNAYTQMRTDSGACGCPDTTQAQVAANLQNSFDHLITTSSREQIITSSDLVKDILSRTDSLLVIQLCKLYVTHQGLYK
jgi:hypothetical protein